MNKDGFSLMEIMIYCCISSMLGILICQFYTSSYRNFQHVQRSGQYLMALYATHDAIVRDMEMASPLCQDWDIQEQLVCKVNKECIGWECKKGKLYRITGMYDFARKEWQEKSRALIAQNVNIFEYQLINRDNALSQSISLGLGIGDSDPLKRTVHLFNRVII